MLLGSCSEGLYVKMADITHFFGVKTQPKTFQQVDLFSCITDLQSALVHPSDALCRLYKEEILSHLHDVFFPFGLVTHLSSASHENKIIGSGKCITWL